MSNRNEDTDKPKTETETETGGKDEAKDDNGLNFYHSKHLYLSETKAKLVLCEPSCGLLGSPA